MGTGAGVASGERGLEMAGAVVLLQLGTHTCVMGQENPFVAYVGKKS
jgi:hypothetical protein